MYENETDVGRGLAAASVDREEVFVTTKLWRDNLTCDAVSKSTEASLKRLATDYVDLLLIHWPNEDVALEETLEAMDRLRAAGKTHAIGVSNFPRALWRRALDVAPVGVNQVEFHPFLDQSALLSFARERELQLVAYTPLAKGRVTREPVILEIAEAQDRTPTQIALRWLVQHGNVAAIPKAARRTHLEENLHVLEFELTEKEMVRVSALTRGSRFVAPDWSPDWD